MQSVVSSASRPGPGRSSHRDKRYVAPALLVDLMDAVHETPLWSPSQLILKKYEGDLVAGEAFTGAFTFEHSRTTGLFEAKVVKLDASRQMLGAELTWVSQPGIDLMTLMTERRKAEGLEQNPAMRVTITHSTVNWSLSGMLLNRYRGDFQSGQPFRGMIRTEKAQQPGVFTGSVIRVDPDRRTLAMKFQELPSDSFALLEAAIKKSTAN